METLSFDQLPAAVSQLNDRLDNIERLLLEKNEQPPAKQSEQFLSIQEAAEFLNLSVPTIYSKVSRSELPVMKRGNRLYFSSVELMEYLKAGRKKSNAEISAEADEYLRTR